MSLCMRMFYCTDRHLRLKALVRTCIRLHTRQLQKLISIVFYTFHAADNVTTVDKGGQKNKLSFRWRWDGRLRGRKAGLMT